jgi:hypothetical protein
MNFIEWYGAGLMASVVGYFQWKVCTYMATWEEPGRDPHDWRPTPFLVVATMALALFGPVFALVNVTGVAGILVCFLVYVVDTDKFRRSWWCRPIVVRTEKKDGGR